LRNFCSQVQDPNPQEEKSRRRKKKRPSQKRGKTKSIAAAAINPFQVTWPSYSVDFLHLWNFLCSCIKACAISVSKQKMLKENNKVEGQLNDN